MKASIITLGIKAEKMNRFGQPWLGARDARSPMTWCKRPDSAATAGNFVNSPILSPLFLSMYSLTCKLLSETVLRGISKISQSFSKLSAHFFQSPPKNLKKTMLFKTALQCGVEIRLGDLVSEDILPMHWHCPAGCGGYPEEALSHFESLPPAQV